MYNKHSSIYPHRPRDLTRYVNYHILFPKNPEKYLFPASYWQRNFGLINMEKSYLKQILVVVKWAGQLWITQSLLALLLGILLCFGRVIWMLSFIPVLQLSSQLRKSCSPQIAFLCSCPGIYFSYLPSWKILAHFNFVKIGFCYLSMNIWLQVCLCTVSIPGVQGSQTVETGATDSWERPWGAGNLIRVL